MYYTELFYTLHIFNVNKTCRVGLYYAIIPNLFPCFCCSAIPTSCHILLSCLGHFFASSKCMLELKFVIYQRTS